MHSTTVIGLLAYTKAAIFSNGFGIPRLLYLSLFYRNPHSLTSLFQLAAKDAKAFLCPFTTQNGHLKPVWVKRYKTEQSFSKSS
jgi:hypothetical protein